MPPAPPLAFLGIPVHNVGMDESLEVIQSFIEKGGPSQVITANPLMILAAQDDAGLKEAFSSAGLVVPDGAGLTLSAALKGFRLRRVAGIDLMYSLCERASRSGWRVFFFGAAPGVAASAAESLCRRFPGLSVVGTRSGYFKSEEESSILSAIREYRPDLLFVALSTPFQDRWIHQNISRLGAKVSMGVGGSFDVLSGRLRRAPAWMRALGLEWLYRLIQEPFRWRRMLGLPVFLLKTLLPMK